jgi:hypothetical protein
MFTIHLYVEFVPFIFKVPDWLVSNINSRLQIWPLLSRWFVKQIYVSTADPKVALVTKTKVNKKGGTTVSTGKVGGWGAAFSLAQDIGSWPKKNKQTQKSAA